VRTDAVAADELDRLIRRTAVAVGGDVGPRPLLPTAAEPYFRAWAVDGTGATVTVPAAFSVVVVTDGSGTVSWVGGVEPISRGDALVIPHAAGAVTFSAGVGAVVAQPPAPDAPDPLEAGTA
jgi:mannose-6-phosphate isomerase